jgi:hypothetical protein
MNWAVIGVWTVGAIGGGALGSAITYVVMDRRRFREDMERLLRLSA